MNMKKIFAILLALTLAAGLCACGSSEGSAEETTAATEADTEATPEASTEAATAAETEVPEGMVVYTVKVVDENGDPVVGAMVQICQDTCYPGVTNEEGVAQYTVAEADYKVSFLSMPEGYTCDEEAFYFQDGSTALTITLKAAA